MACSACVSRYNIFTDNPSSSHNKKLKGKTMQYTQDELDALLQKLKPLNLAASRNWRNSLATVPLTLSIAT
jgi:hypothetical protein